MLTNTRFRAQITKQFKLKRSRIFRLTRVVEIGIMVVIIIGVAVVIPVVANVTESAGLTGTTKTLVDLLPLFIAIALNGLLCLKKHWNQEIPRCSWSLLNVKTFFNKRWAIAMP